MKDEELAEEYICIRKCQDDGKKSFLYCRTCTRLKDFLAGLKVGRPQWHDLRKDPNDLPDEGTYLVVWQNNKGYKEIFIMNYEEDEEELHWVDGDCEVQDEYVIAWCELPTFDKE